jgi:serralysin
VWYVSYESFSTAINVYFCVACTTAQSISYDTNTNSPAYLDLLLNVSNVRGTSAADTFNGDAYANIMQGGAGNDVFNGGAGSDTVDYSYFGSIHSQTQSQTYAVYGQTYTSFISLAANQGILYTGGGTETDTFSSIENIVGTSFNDAIYGDANANNIFGGVISRF